MEAKREHFVRVGGFVAVGLIIAAALIFIIGEERNLFKSKVVLHTQFRDAAGLRAGSPVRMGGVTVGSVTAVHFGDNARDSMLHVDFELTREALVRVRANSIARIGAKGLLGDKVLDITVGDPGQAEVQNGASLNGEEAFDMSTAMGAAAGIIDRASTIMQRAVPLVENVERATRPFANEQLGNDITALIHDLRLVGDQVATGNGTVGRLLRDERMAGEINDTLLAARGTMRNLQSTAGNVNSLLHDARTGRGLIHALIYDEAGTRVVRSMGSAADEFSQIARDVRTGNGGLHRIIYGNEMAEAMSNINETTASVRDIVRDVQRGRGTLGALLTDPSLYEDLKSLVGNVQRNEILRAMVRYSIHANERDAQAPVTANTPSSSQ